jgi:hypothetical protein
MVAQGLSDMGGPSKAVTLWVAKSVFEGLADLVFENAVTLPEIERLLRAVCVHAIARKLERETGMRNDTQTAIALDVDRHVVSRLLESAPLNGARASATPTTMRVVEGWENECSAEGLPRELNIGDQHSVGPTVWALVQRFAPGMWPSGIIKEMIRVQLVKRVHKGRLRLKRRVRSSTRREPSAHELEDAAVRMRDVMRATFHDFADPQSKRLWRTALSDEIDIAHVHVVRTVVADQMESMMERVAVELNSPRLRQGRLTGRKVRLGAVGFTVEEVLGEELRNENGATADGSQRPKTRSGKRTIPIKPGRVRPR